MMVLWLRPEYILAFITSLYFCSQLVSSKTYEKFWCATEEGLHQLSCPDESALLTDISIRKVYRRTQMCEPDDHSEYLIHCQSYIDSSLCEGNKTCSITISSQDYLQCQNKIYVPTYFFVKYTCTQIHRMCTDTIPIRNTLYGYIVSPAYPHPMADNLKCSISIEADPTMFIELSPIQVHLQDAIKCRAEYIEIFGYDPSNKTNNNMWKAYHTWCGTMRSLNNPLPTARYLITSNSLYMSLQTTISKKPRYFKIRYKIVPSAALSQYNSDGIAFDSVAKEQTSFDIGLITTTNILSTTTIIPLLNNSDVKSFHRTIIQRIFKKKEILIGIIAGIIVLLIAISIGIFIFIKRRRSSSNTRKKPISSTISNTTSKSLDKAPLLEQTNNTSTAVNKRKLVPERTVQISDVGTSKFKSNDSKPDSSTIKPTLTAADSGIYGAEELSAISKPISDPSKIIPDVDKSEPIPTVVVNPLTENSTLTSIIIPSDTIENTPSTIIVNEEQKPLIDKTIQSAYSNIIDATTSENEGTLCGSTPESRRSSTLIVQESIILTKELDSLSHNIIPFNPLHVILKKDANKYYTTEYI